MVQDIKFYDMSLTFLNDEFREVSIEQVVSIETKLKFKFPQVMKEYFLNFNGGQLVDDCLQFKSDDYIKLADIYILKSSNKSSDFEHLYYCGDNAFWPKHLIPFGCDEGGHEFCFSIAPDDYGAIYFHMSEWTGEPEEIQFLAKDFLSFLKNLRPESEFE